MLIGLSVSHCISDIAQGKVDPDQVAYIIGGINPTHNGDDPDDGIENIISNYNSTYWRHIPNAERIFRDMWQQGRILCPRMSDKEGRPQGRLLMIVEGHWLACEQVHKVEEYFGEPDWM